MRAVGHHRAEIGESPVWHAEEGCLWHLDIAGHAAIRTDLGTGEQRVVALPDAPGTAGALPGRGIVVTLPQALVAVRADAPVQVIRPLDIVPPTHRFNDGTVDPAGRILVGTCAREAPRGSDGVLWNLAADAPPRVLLTGFRLVNGLAVSPDGRTLHLSDSAPESQRIWRCPYDPATGEVGERSLLLDMTELDGRPDGAAFDAQGGYWIAATEGGALLRLGPDGAVEERVACGTPRPSKPVFAGPLLDRLLVTTISRSVPKDDLLAGRLLELETRRRGHPYDRAAVGPIETGQEENAP